MYNKNMAAARNHGLLLQLLMQNLIRNWITILCWTFSMLNRWNHDKCGNFWSVLRGFTVTVIGQTW